MIEEKPAKRKHHRINGNVCTLKMSDLRPEARVFKEFHC